MTQSAPRIPPLPRARWTNEMRDIWEKGEGPDARENGSKHNVMMMLPWARELYAPWLSYNFALMHNQTIPRRLQELVILRTSWLNRCEYVYYQHVKLGREHGLDDEDFAAIRDGKASSGWSAGDHAAVRMVDELLNDHVISDALWAELRAHFDEEEVMLLMFAMGTYNLLSWTFNSAGLQLDEGLERPIGFG